MNPVLEAIAGRRSCRQFLTDQIADVDLDLILEAGLQAPSGHNDQSWYFVVVQDAALIQEMSEGSKAEMQKMPVEWIANAGRVAQYNIYYNAPTVLLVCARKDAVSAVPDVSAAIQNMMLAAESLGLASCWIGFTRFYFTAEDKYRRLGIPEGYEVHYGLSLGYGRRELKPEPPVRKYPRYHHRIR